MENMEYLFSAYTVVWLLIFGYMFSVSRRQKAIDKKIVQLEEMGSDA